MEILRVPPYDVVEASLTIPAGYSSESFVAYITDMADLSVSSQTFTGSSDDEFTVSLSAKFDGDYYVEIQTEDGTLVIHDTYEVRRPYVLATEHATTASEISEYRKNEELARAIIDSIVREGFYYQKKTVEIPGSGTDFLPVWDKVVKVASIYENNVLVEDRTFGLSKDRTAIVELVSGPNNRDEQAPLVLPSSSSDSGIIGYSYLGFPKNWDYRVVYEHGYPTVPSDVVRATEMLIDDISCGRMDYFKNYVSSYNTDQFKIQFEKGIFDGTGNLIVDKILSKYKKLISRPGVL
jgi:hypothetical protein